jgi:site-specific recombinase XerD
MMTIQTPTEETIAPSSIFNFGRRPHRKDYRLPEEYQHELDRFALAHARKSVHTQRVYWGGVRLFLAFLSQRWGAPSVEAISREHAQTFQDFMANESGYAPATVASMLISARLFCKRLVEGDVIDKDPFGSLAKLAPPQAPDVRILTTAEVQSMINAAKKERSVWGARDMALICTLYSAGVRQQELLCLHPADVDWGRCTVTIRRGKGGAPRTIGLDHNAMKALEQYDRKRLGHISKLPSSRREQLRDVFWISRRGGALSPSGLLRALQQRGREGGVDAHIHPHMLRHAAATHDTGAGLGDMELRDKFGWSPRSAMPWRYTRQQLRERTIERSQRLGASSALRV